VAVRCFFIALEDASIVKGAHKVRMIHQTPLIATLVAALGLAFVFGTIANRLRLPSIVGYLVAGVVIGPFTPGFVADQMLAQQLSEGRRSAPDVRGLASSFD
jgi:Sodium/hydrogen exchanger family